MSSKCSKIKISLLCWREKVVSVFGFGHSKSDFRAPDFGHFCQKCPFSGARKWVLECPKWWPGEENAPKIIFFGFLVYFYINTKYIKLDRNFENFLIFWCTLLSTGRCTPLSPVQLFLRWSLSMFLRCAIRLYRFPESTPKFGGIFHLL